MASRITVRAGVPALVLLALQLVAAAPANAIQVTNGTLVGISNDGVAGFLGIPFAAAPVGALRFKLPTPHAAWTEPRDASVAGPHCTQGDGPEPAPPPGCAAWCQDEGYASDECGCGVCGSHGGCTWSCNASESTARHPLHKCPSPVAAASSSGEDCLYLNAFTPLGQLQPNATLKPVLFYIHGAIHTI